MQNVVSKAWDRECELGTSHHIFLSVIGFCDEGYELQGSEIDDFLYIWMSHKYLVYTSW